MVKSSVQKERNTQKTHPKKRFRFNLQWQLLSSIVIPLLIILTLLTVVLTVQSVNIVSQVKSNNMQNQVDAASRQVEEYFKKFFIIQEFTRDRRFVKSLLEEAELDSNFRAETSESFSSVVSDLDYAQTIAGDAAQTAWLAIINNDQAILSDGSTTGADFHIKDRVWYDMILNSQGETVITPAYTDATTGEMVVSIASPYLNDAGKLVGVIGLDIYMSQLSSYLSDIHIGDTGYLTIYDSADNVIYHPDQNVLFSSLNGMNYSSNMKTALEQHQDSSVMKYHRGNLSFYGTVTHIDDFNWNIVGCMPTAEFMREPTIAMLTVIAGSVVCSIILIIICVRKAKSLVTPIHQLNRVANELAQGNLKVAIQSYNKDDEIGDLTKVFVSMQSTLQEIIEDIGHVIGELSNKNLTVSPTASYQQDFVPIENALEGIAERMNTVMSVIQTTAVHVDAGADQVSKASQILAQGSTEQASSVEEMAATIQQISRQIELMSDHSNDASHKARQVGTDVLESSQKMEHLMGAMERIDQSSNEIQKIIKTIEDIAFQTNILALNAAVEAARAGAAGKGFAVVADEVRSLASRSADAAKSTTHLIADCLSAIQHGDTVAEETAQALEQIQTSAESVTQKAFDISDKTNDQTSMVNHINGEVVQISELIQTMAASAQESAATSRTLSQQAVLLHQLSER